MFLKASLILTLLVSLLFGAQAGPLTMPVEMKQGGVCAGMECGQGCCTNVACCRMIEQQKAPQKPAPAPQSRHVQLADLGLRAAIVLFVPPAGRRPFVILDEASAAHTPSPLAVNCIRLI